MKILAVAEFDPAGVLTGHRAALRALGVDYRLAVRDVYAEIPVEADYWRAEGGPLVGLLEFAAEADVVQFHPSIGQPFSYSSLEPHFGDGEDGGDGIVQPGMWKHLVPRARRVSLFHGSRNAAAPGNAEAYATHWRGRGHAIWATTLDYVHRMGAAYAPPSVDVRTSSWVDSGEGRNTLVWYDRRARRAPPRQDDDPLIVVQAPTDPDNCHTAVLLAAAREVGAVVDLVQKRPRAEVWRRKARAHAGFDHLRGSFSVNTVENLAIGLAPLVGLRPEYREALCDAGLNVPGGELAALLPFHTEEGFRKRLRELAADPELTRLLQQAARAWYESRWTPDKIGVKLKKMYEAL